MTLYIITEAIKGLYRARLASLITLVTLTIAVSLTVSSSGLYLFSGKIESKIKERVAIKVFLKDSISNEELGSFKEYLKNSGYVKTYDYISKARAAKDFKRRTEEDFIEILGENPLPASFNLRLIPEQLTTQKTDMYIKELKDFSFVDEVSFDYTLAGKILNVLDSTKNIIIGIAVLFFILSVYLVYSTNKLVINAKLTQYNNMKLVGARLYSIKFPVYLQGIILGFFSGILSVVFFYFCLILINKLYPVDFSVYYKYTFHFVAAIISVGIVLGLTGGILSTRKISLKVKL